MPLILAIEPDRRQANQLTAVVKARLHADLVLGESAERALAALGDRVPDLILTSALLSPNDEVVLGERLRAFDGAAAHVQTLTIPVLAPPRPRVRAKAGGMLSALRRGKARPAAPDGCDPAVFAAQCAEYLERAVTEHAVSAAARAEHAEPVVEVPEPAPAPVAPVSAPIEPAAPVTVASVPLTIDTSSATATVQEAIAQLEAFVQREQRESMATPEPAAPREDDEELPDGFIELDLSFLDDPPGATSNEEATEPDVYEIDAVGVEIDVVRAEPVPESPAMVPDVVPVIPARLGVRQLWPPMDGVSVEPPSDEGSEVRRALIAARAQLRREQARQKPVQDEWGFFDPEQCGFAALLAKLDEIADPEESAPPAKPSRPSKGSRTRA